MRRIAAILFLMALSSALWAQTTGKIAGSISDKSTGEGLVGVNVVIEGTYLGAASDIDGKFFILNIPPGTYNLRFMLIGYKTMKLENVQVNINRTRTLDIKMEETTLDLGEEIVVTADRVAVRKDQTSSIRNVSAEDIALLPIENTGRIVSMQPGVVQGHFRGGRSNETAYMIDGVSTYNGLNRGQMVSVDPDAIQEVEVITGTFSAKYGEAMSGVVNVVTKEGGNDIHGKVEGYLANYLTPHTDIFIGLKPEQVARNQDYKFMLDGPILKNRLTFFVSGRYENNDGYLNGIRRFNITDEPNYGMWQDSTLHDPVTGEYFFNQHTGDGEYVPMDWYEGLNINSKLTYKMKNIKMSLMYLLNKGESQGYSHSRKYKPDGRSANHSINQMYTYQLNHILSQRAFYELKLSYSNNDYGGYVFENPLDSRYVHDRYSANEQYTGFVTGGQDKGHSLVTSEKLLARLDLTWQVTHNHNIETGFEFDQFQYDNQYHTILNLYRNTQASGLLYAPQIMPDSTVYTDMYKKEPLQIAAWLSDKMEYDNMVIELGMRAEYFDPKTTYPSNYRNPNNLLQKADTPEWISTYPDADARFNIAPRLGLSYQLGKMALLRFSYGHFYQYPPHSTMYQNNSYVIAPTNYESTLGNPQVQPEMTVNYEIGLWQMLNDYMDLEIALWYKDIYNLSTVNVVTTYNAVRYGLYGNKDYGNARGLEVKYNTHIANLYAEINYTLQYTRGNADNPQFTFTRAGNSQDPIPTLIPMSWDQRHTMNISVGYNAKDYGISAMGWFGSGSAYTWSPIDQNPLNRVYLFPNNASKPFHYTVDLQAHYDWGSIMGAKLRWTVRVYNLFDRLNEDNVNSNTGRTNQAIIRPQDRLGHWSDFSTYEERIYSPSNWSSPRLVKLGLGVFF
ncbi:TonB-dependent receptor [candidate division KSB1 bacterium]|nr:TonB-dependent receptor [candidate division KSB1 bacterium]